MGRVTAGLGFQDGMTTCPQTTQGNAASGGREDVTEQGGLRDALSTPAQLELVLAGRQRALLSALEEKDPKIGIMYKGALHVLQTANPDRLALAGHAIRELMEKLPQYLDVPSRRGSSKGQPSLTVKVRELEEHWTHLSDEDLAASELTPRMRKFSVKAKKFFIWFQGSYPKRRAETAAALRALDGSGKYLPAALEDIKIKHWVVCNEFFQAVAHHLKTSSEVEFLAFLSDLELFLLDHLRPRTFEDFASLDEIIKEGESDA